jgi:hypothetical protein
MTGLPARLSACEEAYQRIGIALQRGIISDQIARMTGSRTADET